MIHTILPVKRLTDAKHRLSGLLTPLERETLATAMLTDVLTALMGSALSTRKFVVTSDPAAAELALARGIEVLEEGEQLGESESVDAASKRCMELGALSVLRIPGDIPLVSAGDIDTVLSTPTGERGIVMAPARDRLGTNAMLRTPPDVIRSQFGHDSLRKHIARAVEKGVRYTLVEPGGFALDIDEPADLVELMRALGKGCARSRDTAIHTRLAIMELGLAGRIEQGR